LDASKARNIPLFDLFLEKISKKTLEYFFKCAYFLYKEIGVSPKKIQPDTDFPNNCEFCGVSAQTQKLFPERPNKITYFNLKSIM
jgi:hypothetical protein